MIYFRSQFLYTNPETSWGSTIDPCYKLLLWLDGMKQHQQHQNGGRHKILPHIVTFVVPKVCNLPKVVTIVGGVTFVPARLLLLWLCDICPPLIVTFVGATRGLRENMFNCTQNTMLVASSYSCLEHVLNLKKHLIEIGLFSQTSKSMEVVKFLYSLHVPLLQVSYYSKLKKQHLRHPLTLIATHHQQILAFIKIYLITLRHSAKTFPKSSHKRLHLENLTKLSQN